MGVPQQVVIVGSGPGGAVTAFGLAKRGIPSVVLEAGPRYSAQDYPHASSRFELIDPFKPHPLRDRYTASVGQLLASEYSELNPTSESWSVPSSRRGNQRLQRVKGVGGTSLHFEAQMMRPSRAGLEAWPILHSELVPYFERIEHLLDVGGATELLPGTRKYRVPRDPLPMSMASRVIAKGAATLGWNLVPQALAILAKAKPEDGRGACVACGCCLKGCVPGAKASMDVTFLRWAEATGLCRIMPGWRVRRIELNQTGAFQAVVGLDAEGKEQRVEGVSCVLSAGAVETPRLLLMSKLGGDQVGVGYMETNVHAVVGQLPAELKTYQGITVDNVLVDFLDSDATRGFSGGISGNATAGGAALIGPVKHALRMTSGWGDAQFAEMKRTFGGAMSFVMSGEPTWQATNTISLDTNVTDDLGDPVPRVTHSLAPNDLSMLRFMRGVARDILLASGAEQVNDLVSSYSTPMGAEPRGGCRIGLNKNQSVVNSDHQVHGVPGLYVSDASIFPSATVPANPSLTIMATAWRCADRLAGALGGPR